MRYALVKTLDAEIVEIDATGEAERGDYVTVVYSRGGIAQQVEGRVEETYGENPYGSDHRCGYIVQIHPTIGNPDKALRKARKAVQREKEADEVRGKLAEAAQRAVELGTLGAVAAQDDTVAQLMQRLSELQPDDKQLADAVAAMS